MPRQFGFPSKIPDSLHATLVVAGRKSVSVYMLHVCVKNTCVVYLFKNKNEQWCFNSLSYCYDRKQPSELGDSDTPTLYKIRPEFCGFIVIFFIFFPILSSIDTMNYIILDIYFVLWICIWCNLYHQFKHYIRVCRFFESYGHLYWYDEKSYGQVVLKLRTA